MPIKVPRCKLSARHKRENIYIVNFDKEIELEFISLLLIKYKEELIVHIVTYGVTKKCNWRDSAKTATHTRIFQFMPRKLGQRQMEINEALSDNCSLPDEYLESD